MNNLIKRFWQELPVLFPLVAIAHIAWLGFAVFSFVQQGVIDTFIGAGNCIVMLLYTVLWIAVCDRWRWAAIGYLVLTAVNLCLQFFTAQHSEWRYVADALFPFDLLMCFFVLFYYKRFR
jgi:hypothetical protein